MRLLGSFFSIVESTSQEGGGLTVTVRTNPAHVIYKAHFPQLPLTPGACQIRMATEILEKETGLSLSLKALPSLKFIAPLPPGERAVMRFDLSARELREGMPDSLGVAVVVRAEDGRLVSKMSLSYEIKPGSRAFLKERSVCVIIPYYNNKGSVRDVAGRALEYCEDVIMVDDGSTDGSSLELGGLPVQRIGYRKNGGKGHALKTGLLWAKTRGFKAAITLDADGQHFPEDIPLLARELEAHPGAMIVGSRNLREKNMPGKNSFANNFSNFWFHLQTGLSLPDTQSGFRLYQLGRLGSLALLTSRYESELELLVFQCWKGIEIIPVGVRVYYPPESERVSHFRPFADFARISVLNTFLCIIALPMRLGK